jgi:iron complex outermembrane receptor protein
MRNFHKTILTASASVLAVALAAPAFAQDKRQVDEVVVTGIRASLQASVEAKRNANAVIDVITAEDIGKFPDKNVAESLQRVRASPSSANSAKASGSRSAAPRRP